MASLASIGLEVKGVVISGGFGKLGQAVIQSLARDHSLIILARPGGRPLLPKSTACSPIIIEVDLLSDHAGDYLVSAFARLPPVHALVNAAADTDFHMFSTEILGRQRAAADQLSLNVIGPAVCTAAMFESQWKDRPLERDPVSVLNISSVSGKTPFHGTRQCIYAASKAALNMLTLYMAKEYEPFNVRVNGLAPGNLTPAQKMQQAAQAVRAIIGSSHSGKVFELS